MKKWMNDTLAAVREEGIIPPEAPKYEQRWKRLEIMSSSGSTIMKDDKLPAGDWSKATEPFDFGEKERVPDLDPDTFVSRKGLLTRYGKRKYTEIKSSYGTTVTMKEDIPERGIQIRSVSGHSLVMEDTEADKVLPPWNTNLDLDPTAELPPWNTNTYNGPDEEIKPIVDFNDKTTYPKIYGFRTPQKHTIGYKEGDNGDKGTFSEPDRR